MPVPAAPPPARSESAREEPGAGLLREPGWIELALASMRDGVLVFDERGALLHANPTAVAYDTPSAPRVGVAERGLYHADRRTPYRDEELPLRRALRGEAVADAELFMINASFPRGVDLLVSASTLRTVGGAVRGAVVVFRDVTERRAQERRIAVAEQQKKAILDNLPDIAWLKDVDGRFLAANRRLAESAGLTLPEEVVGLTDHDLWPKELADGYRATDLEVMRTGKPARLEERLVDASGRAYWIETVKAAVVSSGGEVLGTTGLARDVTQRREAELALRQLAGELEARVAERTAALEEAQETLVRSERLAVLGQLAGGVAHQIRNPLAAIMNASYVLRRHLDPDAVHTDVDHALRIIHDEVRHANTIITGLLDFARVRSLERQPADLGELAQRALAAEEMPAGIVVERVISPTRPVDVDVDQITSALGNVVRNAIEAMAEGGTLSLEVRDDGDDVLVAISDTGPGLSAQVLAHLFEPLRSTKPLGVGLGLVTARTFVEAHRGRIEAKPAPRGARFELRIPRAT